MSTVTFSSFEFFSNGFVVGEYQYDRDPVPRPAGPGLPGLGDLVPLGRVFKLSKAVTFSDLNFRALN